jgi:hypothetical protein
MGARHNTWAGLTEMAMRCVPGLYCAPGQSWTARSFLGQRFALLIKATYK